MISKTEKLRTAIRLRDWLLAHPELKFAPLAKRIQVGAGSFSNFMAGMYLLKFEKMILLEKYLEETYGYVRDAPPPSLPEEYVPVTERKPSKKGKYLIKGINKKTKREDFTLAKWNGVQFYNCDGIKPACWKAFTP